MPGAFTGIVASSIASGFTPPSISALLLWFKADSLTLTDGNPVSMWPDSSPNANNATASGTARPTFKTAIINGLPVVRFDGSTNVMTFTEVAPIYGTMFVVSKKTGFNNVYFGGPIAQAGLMYFSDGNLYWISNAVDFLYVSVGNNTAWHVDVYRRAAAGMDFYRDGTHYVDGSTSLVYTNINMMGHRGSGEYLDGDVAEILLYTTDLGSTDVTTIQTYLSAKYGL